MTWGPGGVAWLDSASLSDADAAIVAEVSETRTKSGGSLKVKLHSKLDALEKLAKHVGVHGNERGEKTIVIERSYG